MDEEELRYLIELRDTTQRTLRQLRLQKATFGLGVPAHIDIGIKQGEKDVRVLNAKLETIQPSQIVTDAVGAADTGLLLLEHRLKQVADMFGDALTQITEKVSEITEKVSNIASQVTEHKILADQRYEQEQLVRIDRQREHDERLTIIDNALELNTEQVSLLAERISSRRWLEIAVVVLSLLAIAIYWQFLR